MTDTTTVVDDYSGPFDADFDLHRLSRSTLSMLAREVMLAGHLQDRSGIPAAMAHHPDEAWELAIDEWMATSPVYTRRMQHLLEFEGTGVSTIFKGLQLDIGFAHQFMDVHFELHDESDGEFWLTSCGALHDVAPMGTDMVHTMCHDVEDPTFDATAVATNARAQVRPVHRPPAIPAGGPECHWTVSIRPDNPEVSAHRLVAAVAQSRLADLVHGPAVALDPGGRDAYDGPFDPTFELEDLSHRALQLVTRELAVQGHLLARGFQLAAAGRWGPETAVALGRELWAGVAWVESERLVPVLGVDPTGLAAIAKVLQVHHLLLPRDYLGISIEMPDAHRIRVTLDDAPALAEGDPYSVAGLLDLGADEILASAAHGVNARARLEPVAATGARAAWEIALDPSCDPAPEPGAVAVTRVSTGTTQVFVRRKPVRR